MARVARCQATRTSKPYDADTLHNYRVETRATMNYVEEAFVFVHTAAMFSTLRVASVYQRAIQRQIS